MRCCSDHAPDAAVGFDIRQRKAGCFNAQIDTQHRLGGCLQNAIEIMIVLVDVADLSVSGLKAQLMRVV